MKRIRNIPVLFIVFLLFINTSCQKEKEEFIDENNEEETITLDSILTKMLVSASQNNGYIDNIIDGSSCLSVALPVTVVANDQEVVLVNEADYALIVAIFDEFENDIDTLEIVFPIWVVFERFNRVQVESEAVLNSIISACQNDIDDTYTCVDFVYPIECFIYNNNSEQTGFITLNDSREWFDYLNYLQDGIFIEINYPMGVVIDGNISNVNNNEALFELMSVANCDLSGGTIDPVAFENKLTTASWYINLYDGDGMDSTCDYASYEFEFNSNGTATATSPTNVRNGSWILDDNNDELNLILDFETTGGNDPFSALIAVWDVVESTAQTIKLKDPSSGNGAFDYLYFGRDAATNCGSGNGQLLINTLLDGSWFVEAYFDNGTNETGNFNSFTVTFESGGIVVATGGIYTYYGTWAVEGTEELYLVLDFGVQLPFSEFNNTWDVINFDANRVVLRNLNSGTDSLIFEKL